MIKINHSVAEDSSDNIEVNRTEPYVIFTINNDEFGVAAKKVLELVKYMPPLAMPNNYHNSCGMSVFHGKIVPIVDMRMIFGLETVVDHNTVIILVESSIANFGIIAEQILDINYFPINSIKTIDCYNLGEKTKYLKNVANIDGRLILLLDLEKIIEPKQEQAVLEEPAASRNTARFEISVVSLEEDSNKEPSNFLIDPQELEALLQECESEVNYSSLNPERNNGEKFDHTPSVALLDPLKIEAILDELNNENQVTKDTVDDFPLNNPEEKQQLPDVPVDNFPDDIINTEQVAEILSDMEAELAFDSPENTETTPTMGVEPKLAQQSISEEAIEDILRELEAEARLKIEGTPNSNNQILKIEKRDTTEEIYDD